MLHRIDLSRVDLNLLVLFDVVLQERHVGRTATRLHLSPSAVSHGLTRLRRLLDDPLFLRTPRGVVPSARALELAEDVADVLARVKRIVTTVGKFDPATSTRRFVIGAPDGIAAAFLPALLTSMERTAPGVDIGIRELLPSSGSRSPGGSFWTTALAGLDSREMDVAVLPIDRAPGRFAAAQLYDDDFVLAMRAGHPLRGKVTLERFCNLRHVLVSLAADAYGFIDEALARRGRSRRIALTVPNFMTALDIVARSDFVAAVSRRFAAVHARRFGVVTMEAPIPLRAYSIRAITPRVALLDHGVAWFVEELKRACREK